MQSANDLCMQNLFWPLRDINLYSSFIKVKTLLKGGFLSLMTLFMCNELSESSRRLNCLESEDNINVQKLRL